MAILPGRPRRSVSYAGGIAVGAGHAAPSGLFNIKDAGCICNGVADDRTALNTLFTSLVGFARAYVEVVGTPLIGSDLTIPANVHFVWVSGGRFKLAAGVTVSGFEPRDAGRYQIVDLPTDGAPTNPQLTGWVDGWTTCDAIFPEWFGAKGDFKRTGTTFTGTDDAYAWCRTVQTAIRNKVACISYAASHYFGSKVVLLRPNLTLKGPNGSGGFWWPETGKGLQGELFAGPDVDCIFDWGGGLNNGFGSVLRLDGVIASGGSQGGGGTKGKRFMRITELFVGPMYPFNVRNCYFHNFSEAAFDVAGASPILGQTNIEGSHFHDVNYAFRQTGAMSNFRFVGNNCRSNARISLAGVGGSVDIHHNTLEGNNNALTIACGMAHVEIGPNYMEACGGSYLIKITATNPFSTARVARQFDVSRSAPYILSVDGVRLETDLSPREIEVLSQITYRSRVGEAGGGFYVPDVAYFFASLDPRAHVGVPSPTGLASSATHERSGTLRETPWGFQVCERLATIDAAYQSTTLGVTAGHWVMMFIPVRYTDAIDAAALANPHVIALDQVPNLTVGSINMTNMSLMDGGWTLLAFAFKAAVGATGLKWKLNPYGSAGQAGAGCDVGPAFICTMTAGVKFIRPFVPTNGLVMGTLGTGPQPNVTRVRDHRLGRSAGIAVAQVATVILTLTEGAVESGGVAIVSGSDGTTPKRFTDVVAFSYSSATVVVLATLSGASPAARTYSKSASSFDLKLAMASGNYTVNVSSLELSGTV